MVCASKTLLALDTVYFYDFLLTYFLLDSYIKAADPSNFAKVIKISSHAGKHDDPARFLRTACKSLCEPKIDTELAYAYAKTDRLHDMEDFLGMTNSADILVIEEKCFEDELYQAAQLLFTSISNWAGLATTLIYLGENQAAVESARKASNTQYVIRYLSC
jgi:clathrin heavy chain